MPDSAPPRLRIVDHATPTDERAEVVAALAASPARIAPKYFYDDLGCALYAAICRLPEYYPTRTELAIFAAHHAEIAQAIGRGRQFVDLGAGDCGKARAWLAAAEPVRYIPMDIARAELERALAELAADFPALEITGVVTDFTQGLPLGDVLDERPATFFYPGSSIGNFTPAQTLDFLRRILGQCASRPGSNLLIGVDGKKDKRVLDAAYDDALGVTAAFNLNVLRHLNRRFGFDFAVERFAHRGFYSEADSRIEMHLEAKCEQRVRLGDRERHFATGERIHTENSHKYTAAEFELLLQAAGFRSVRRWSDPQDGYFVFVAA